MSGDDARARREVVAPLDGGDPAPARELTLSPERLAGSDACLNCGTPLKGPFCYFCGQPDRNFMRFFPVLLREFLEDFLDLDSRFARTMKPLLFKPGRLTRDYLEGRRFRYTPPMRLYLFSSIAFFLLATMLSTIKISFGTPAEQREIVQIEAESEEQARQVEDALSQLPSGVRGQISVRQEEAGEEESAANAPSTGEPGASGGTEDEPAGASEQAAEAAARRAEEAVEENWFEASDIRFNDKPWDRETNPVEIGWLPDWFNDWINDEIERSPEKAKQINENPDLIVRQVFDILPATMFVLLPVVALIFKFWYLFARRYYIEHLIFALHNHAFIFVALTGAILLGLVRDWLGGRGMEVPMEAARWAVIAIWIWVPLYLLISLRHVYRQNWVMTLVKYGVVGISYLTLLGLVTTVVAILSFLLV